MPSDFEISFEVYQTEIYAPGVILSILFDSVIYMSVNMADFTPQLKDCSTSCADNSLVAIKSSVWTEIRIVVVGKNVFAWTGTSYKGYSIRGSPKAGPCKISISYNPTDAYYRGEIRDLVIRNVTLTEELVVVDNPASRCVDTSPPNVASDIGIVCNTNTSAYGKLTYSFLCESLIL